MGAGVGGAEGVSAGHRNGAITGGGEGAGHDHSTAGVAVMGSGRRRTAMGSPHRGCGRAARKSRAVSEGKRAAEKEG
jgi:hypothetical protein